MKVAIETPCGILNMSLEELTNEQLKSLLKQHASSLLASSINQELTKREEGYREWLADFKQRLAEDRENYGRRFYARRDSIDIGPFPTNGLAWEWADRNLKGRGGIVWEMATGPRQWIGLPSSRVTEGG
jgi:hypothetical protein